ncbi:MAG: ArnT family glycosyltransferase [Chitinophagales bacterium]
MNQRWVVLLVLAAALLFFAKVGMPLTDGDSAYYGTIARRIVETGDWITLHSRSNDFVDKPPLSIWMIAAAYRVFGVSDWTTRLVHSLVAVGTVLLTYALARRFYRPRTAFLGAAVLCTSLLLAYMGQVPQQDVPLTFLSILALYGFVRYLQTGRPGAGLLCCLASALGVLNRGLQGVVFPAAVAGAYLSIRAARRRSFWLPPAPGEEGERVPVGRRADLWLTLLGGAVLFTAVAVPWFYLGYLRQGPDFLNYFFGSGNARYLHPIRAGGAWDSVIYLPMLVLGFLPWSGFIFPALCRAWREGRSAASGAGDQGEAPAEGALFMIVWFLVGFLLPFGIRWRVIRYLLPAFPPLAVLIGRTLDRSLAETKQDSGAGRGVWVGAWLTLAAALLFLVSVFIAARPFPQAQAGFQPVILPFLVLFTLTLGAGAAAALSLHRPAWMIGVLAVGSLVSYLTLFDQLDHSAYLLNPWKAAARTVNANARPGDRVVCYGDLPVSSFLRLDIAQRVEPADEAQLGRWLAEFSRPGSGRRFFVLSTGEALDRYRRAHPEAPELAVTRYPGGRVVAVAGAH